MNFDFLPEQVAVQQAVTQVLQSPVGSALRRLEQSAPEARREALEALRSQLASAEQYLQLGRGDDRATTLLHWLAGAEPLAAASASAFLAVEITARLFAGTLVDVASDALRSHLVPELDSGTLWGAVALADAVDDRPATLEPAGDGALHLHGTKAHVAGACWADWLLVSAQDGDGQPRLAFVERTAPGLRVGDPLDTLGLRALPVSPVWLEAVPVPAAQVAGPWPDATPLATLRRRHDLLLAVASVGLTRQSFELARAHADSHRRQGKPIMGYQAVRFALAEMLTLLQTAELAVRRATWSCAAPDAPEAAEADTLVCVAKTFCAETAEQVSRQALQILAAQGYLVPNRVEQTFRDAPFTALAGTSASVCRLQIAETLLAEAAR